MLKNLLSSTSKFADLSIFPIETIRLSEEQPSAIIRRETMTTIAAETDLFDRARSIYFRGRRRYPRKAAGII
jgi:hypothetical protein